MEWDADQIEGIGVNVARLERLMRRLALCQKEAAKMGLKVDVIDSEFIIWHPDCPIRQDGVHGWRQDNVIASVFAPNFDGGAW